MTNYRFYVTQGIVVTEVFPLGEWKFIFDKGKDQVFFRHKLSGKLVFTNRPTESVTDYTYFKNIEDTAKCDILEFLVTQTCSGTTTAIDYFKGTFGTVDGEWDLDRCIFEVEPIPKDLYTCVNLDTPVNILDIASVVTVYHDSTFNNRTYDRARLFSTSILYIAQQSCSGIKGIVSDFFQINPENVSSFNYLTSELNTYTQMCFSHKSDVLEPIPSNAATIAKTSFKKIMNDLRILFNVYWYVDVNDKLRIEHLSFFAETQGLDLTLAKYTTYMAGTKKYKYSRTEMPRYEIWSCPESKQGGKITYDNGCGNTKENESTTNNTLVSLYTDFRQVRYQPSEVTNKDGLVLFATKLNAVTGNYDMYGFFQNEELVIGKLILRFHKWGRPQLDGELEYFESAFDDATRDFGDLLIYNEKKNKEQEQIQIPLCCDDVFDETKLVKTSLGTGEVLKADFDPFNETMKLNLKYGSDNVAELSPTGVGGILLWLKADAGVTEALGQVTNWADQSGNGYHAAQAVFAKQPVLMTTAGKKFIRFDGIDDIMTTLAFIMYPAQRGSIFILTSTKSAVAGVICGSYNSGAGKQWDISVINAAAAPPELRYITFVEAFNFNSQGLLARPSSYAMTDQDFVLFEGIRTSDTELFYWLNGRKPQSLPAVFRPNPHIIAGQPANNIMNIGGDGLGTANRYYTGDIAEILIFNRALTELERQHIEQYFFKKYQFIHSYQPL